MQIIKIQRIIVGLIAVLGIAGFAFGSAPKADAVAERPELPAGCGGVEAPAESILVSRVYAIGVQVYRWSGSSWELIEPVANLYADANYRGKIGTHFIGPTWESNSGSFVVARRIGDCTPDPTAIAWLKLEATTAEGPGIFGKVSTIQRLNTTGGLRPTTAGTTVGEEKRVPYTAEYYFYRASN
jgi:hypothetical protein